MCKERKHAIICLDRLHVMKSNTALDPAFHGLTIPFTRFQFFIIGTKIADAKSSWNSGFLERYSGYSTSKFPGSLIPEEKISWIPESKFPHKGQRLQKLIGFGLKQKTKKTGNKRIS